MWAHASAWAWVGGGKRPRLRRRKGPEMKSGEEGSARSDIYIVGIGMTPFGKFLDRSVKDLTREAVTAALADAGAGLADIEAAWFANTAQSILEGQNAIPGEDRKRTSLNSSH